MMTGKTMLKLATFACMTSLVIVPSVINAQEITTTAQAIDVAVNLDNMPDPAILRIEAIKTIFSMRGNQWEMTLRGDEITYEIEVLQDGTTDFDRDIDDDKNVPTFWNAQPGLAEHETPEFYLQRASEVLSGLNDTYTPTGRAIVEFEVCDPPEPGVQSEYTNGCKNERAVTKWVVFAQVSANVRGEDRNFFKAVTFLDGRVTEVTDAIVSGNW